MAPMGEVEPAIVSLHLGGGGGGAGVASSPSQRTTAERTTTARTADREVSCDPRRAVEAEREFMVAKVADMAEREGV